MKNKNFEAQSNAMHELWNDENRRKEVVEHMKEAGKKRRKHTDIDVRQSEDYKAYQREYQRKYRLAHPDYYRSRTKKKSFKELLEKPAKEHKAVLEVLKDK